MNALKTNTSTLALFLASSMVIPGALPHHVRAQNDGGEAPRKSSVSEPDHGPLGPNHPAYIDLSHAANGGRYSQRTWAKLTAAPFYDGHIMVRFLANATADKKEELHRAAGLQRMIRAFRHVSNAFWVAVPKGRVGDALEVYLGDAAVDYAHPNYIVGISDNLPNDPQFDLLWGLKNVGQPVNGHPGTPGADIRAAEAWDLWNGDPEFRIAVIDTGVDYLHPDIASNIWTNPGEIPDNGIDDDGNGWVDDIHGYDTANDDGDPMDDHYHGTHVAGTIGAAGNNGIGVTGVNWRCKIVALKFLDSGGHGTTGDAVEAMEYVIDEGIRVSNNSWGGGGVDQNLYNVIAQSQTLGHLFVAAAGNAGRDTDLLPQYPSSFNLPNIIAVAATDNDDQLASFSNYGLSTVDLGAPGVNIYSTFGGGGFGYLDGTSMAAPHVAGVAGLLIGRTPSLSWSDARDLILSTARPIPALLGQTVTGGVVNALEALGPGCDTDPAPSVNVYVDAQFHGCQTGTPAYPFDTVGEGVAAVLDGGTVHITQGAYPENLSIIRPITIVSTGGTVSVGSP